MKTIKILCMFLLLSGSAMAQHMDLATAIHELPIPTYQTRCKNFNDVFFLDNNGSNDPDFPEHVFEQTNYEAVNQMERVLINQPEPAGRYIRVLRIIYGLDNGTIKLILFPDFAVDEFADGKDSFIFRTTTTAGHIPDETNVYIFNGNNLQNMPYSAGPKNWVTAYRQVGSIKRRKHGAPGEALENLRFSRTDRSAAAQECSMSFEEINDFLNGAPTIYFSSIPELNEINGFTDYRHGIALSNVDPLAQTYDNTAKAANMGALCPIRCDVLKLIYTGGGSTTHPQPLPTIHPQH